MIKTILSIKKAIYDEYMVAKLSQDKAKEQEIIQKYSNALYEEITKEIPLDKLISSYDDVIYVQNLLYNGLCDYGEGIYGGIDAGHLYSYDFTDRSVTFSENLVHHYTFITEGRRVWFYTDFVKEAYLYADYETGEIIAYLGDQAEEERLKSFFKYEHALKHVLKFSGAESIDDLFSYYLKE